MQDFVFESEIKIPLHKPWNFKNTGDINAPPGSKDKPVKSKPELERRESIDMPSIGDKEDTTKKPEGVERRQSIDMPSIGEDEPICSICDRGGSN